MFADSKIISFVDDIAVVVQLAYQAVATICWSLSTRALQLTDHKTETVLVTNRNLKITTVNTIMMNVFNKRKVRGSLVP